MNNAEHIPMTEILADQDFNCRGKIAPIDVMELAADIEKNGLLQPVLVMPIEHEQYKYKLIAGYRRHFAHTLIHASHILAYIRHDITPTQAQILNLTENLQRKDLNLIQEAKAVARLVRQGMDDGMIANDLGMSLPWVRFRLSILDLNEAIQDAIAEGTINHQQAQRMLKMTDDERFAFLRAIKDADYKTLEFEFSDKKAKKIATNKKKRQDRSAVLGVMHHMQDAAGNGLHTRALAWAAGEITLDELLISFESHCRELDIQYRRPIGALHYKEEG